MADPASDAEALLAALRAAGAEQRAPLQLHALEALARRSTLQAPAIRARLQARLAEKAAALHRQLPSPTATPASVPEPAPSPLRELLDYIASQAHLAPPDNPHRPAPAARQQGKRPELRSVTYFADTWRTLSTEQQLTQTLAQAPENAGPMNSQHLVLRALETMRDTSPDYLQAFMSYVDTLIWLDHADPTRQAARTAGGDGEKKRRGKRKG